MKNNDLKIKEKADFIYFNSGIICSKLINNDKKEEVLNYLQVFLLCDLPICELEETCEFLKEKDTTILFDNNYDSSIKIIFSICNLINKSDYTIEGKISLIDKIRKYMKFITFDESIQAYNNDYVKIKKRD